MFKQNVMIGIFSTEKGDKTRAFAFGTCYLGKAILFLFMLLYFVELYYLNGAYTAILKIVSLKQNVIRWIVSTEKRLIEAVTSVICHMFEKNNAIFIYMLRYFVE